MWKCPCCRVENRSEGIFCANCGNRRPAGGDEPLRSGNAPACGADPTGEKRRDSKGSRSSPRQSSRSPRCSFSPATAGTRQRASSPKHAHLRKDAGRGARPSMNRGNVCRTENLYPLRGDGRHGAWPQVAGRYLHRAENKPPLRRDRRPRGWAFVGGRDLRRAEDLSRMRRADGPAAGLYRRSLRHMERCFALAGLSALLPVRALDADQGLLPAEDGFEAGWHSRQPLRCVESLHQRAGRELEKGRAVHGR